VDVPTRNISSGALTTDLQTAICLGLAKGRPNPFHTAQEPDLTRLPASEGTL